MPDESGEELARLRDDVRLFTGDYAFACWALDRCAGVDERQLEVEAAAAAMQSIMAALDRAVELGRKLEREGT
jgi:hypothetical protein